MARFLLGLAVVALLVVSFHQLAAQPVSGPAQVGADCVLVSNHGSGTADSRACDGGTGHAHCLPHGGCSGFTLPVAQAADTSRSPARWLRPQIRGLLGHTLPLETPPPIAQA